ncbi:hypothetical protein SNEBB_001395 [Seison nebaliae]|nr:hypothetical protein SNEBB_001395 [Seison nebaliae]
MKSLKQLFSINSNNTNNKNEGKQENRIASFGEPLPKNLQKRFAHGVDYNLKVIIRGDINVGKTSLWQRLQGMEKLPEDYEETKEIQIANISWRLSQEMNESNIVKIELWDVVDEAKQLRSILSNDSNNLNSHQNDLLKIMNTNKDAHQQQKVYGLDAQFVQIYQQVDGVIFIYDCTKPWTWKYVESKLKNVPQHIPILILANKIDLFEELEDENERNRMKEMICSSFNFVKTFDRSSMMSNDVQFSICSMKKLFGIQFIHKFFRFPLLLKERITLHHLLEQNLHQLDIIQHSFEESPMNDFFNNRLNMNKSNNSNNNNKEIDHNNNNNKEIDHDHNNNNNNNNNLKNDEEKMEVKETSDKKLGVIPMKKNEPLVLEDIEDVYEDDDVYISPTTIPFEESEEESD